MKNIFLFVAFFLLIKFSFAQQFSSNITTNVVDLTFEKVGIYDVVKLNGSQASTNEIGKPDLPVIVLNYLIPSDKKVANIIVNKGTPVQFTDKNIYPSQCQDYCSSTCTFVNPDISIYTSNNLYPNKSIEIVSDGKTMNYHIISLRIYPVEYLPLSKIVNLYPNISFTIEYESIITAPVLGTISRKSYNLTKQYICSLVANPADFETIIGGTKVSLRSPAYCKIRI